MLITKIICGKKLKNQLYIDGQFYCNLDAETLILNGLKEGQEIDPDRLEKIVFDSSFRKAKEKAFYILERRDHSKFELMSKLKKDFDENIALSVSEKMVDLGLISDESFAEKYAKELLFSKCYSKNRAKFELLKKGINKDIAEMVLDKFDIDTEENIRKLIEKKYKNAFSDEKIKRRAVAFLLRQGYSFEDIRRILLKKNNDF